MAWDPFPICYSCGLPIKRDELREDDPPRHRTCIGRELAAAWTCSCGFEAGQYDAVCSKCGSARLPESLKLVAAPEIRPITPEETLSAIAQDIHTIRTTALFLAWITGIGILIGVILWVSR